MTYDYSHVHCFCFILLFFSRGLAISFSSEFVRCSNSSQNTMLYDECYANGQNRITTTDRRNTIKKYDYCVIEWSVLTSVSCVCFASTSSELMNKCFVPSIRINIVVVVFCFLWVLVPAFLYFDSFLLPFIVELNHFSWILSL